VNFQNTLPDKIVDNHIEVTISSNILDRSRVFPDNGGFFRSLDNTILWNKNTTNNLKTIAPGEGGQISFSLSSLPISPQTILIKNPHIDAHLIMTGERSGLETSIISSSADITIKIPSTLSLTNKSYRNTGIFTNTGPIPPQTDKESTYTIFWTLTNTSNDLKNTTVSALLPAGVEWKSETSPSSERISYNPDTRVVSWDVGNILASTGFIYSAKEVSFKIGITPNINQIGSVPAILLDINAFSIDTYTDTEIKLNTGSLSTRFFDTSFRNGNDIVVK
jgi:hypothetical protein